MGRQASLLAFLCLVVLAAAAAAHPAGLLTGYTRLAHDCADDYGVHSSSASELGHGLVALDVIERTESGKPLLIFHIIVDDLGAADQSETREELRFTTPRETVATVVKTPRNGEGTAISFVSGDEPAFLKTGITAMNPGAGQGEDSARFAFEIGFTYASLKLQNDEDVTAYEVWGSFRTGAGAWTDADVLPGGYHTPTGQLVEGCRKAEGNDPARDADHRRLAAYKAKHSDWSVAPSGGSGGGGDDDPAKNDAPLADFTFTPERPTATDDVMFRDASRDLDGTIKAWAWDFGDGAQASTKDAAHRFADDGVYTVKLTVTDDGGEQASVTKNVRVLNLRPTAAFAFEPGAPVAGATITFTESSTDPDGTVVTWDWDFGDGMTSSERYPTHTYATAGAYTVTLTATDDDGASHTATRELTVKAAGAGGGGTTGAGPDTEKGAPGVAMPVALAALGLLLVALARRRT